MRTPTRSEGLATEAPVIPVHRDRAERIRRWHADQAHEAASPVAMLSIQITDRGQICSQALAIEPEHAAAMLDELSAIMTTLRAIASRRRAHLSRVK